MSARQCRYSSTSLQHLQDHCRGLDANGFTIAERLKAQQIVIDSQMTYFNMPTPALAFLAPADSDGSNWIGDIVNGDEAGFSAKVTEVTFELERTKIPGW